MTFATYYRYLVEEIMERGVYEQNARTRSGLRWLPHGRSFHINLSDNILPTCGLRRVRPAIAAAETAWCFMGTMSIEWLNKYTKVWNAFADDGNVTGAYGYRWKHAFEIDQIQAAIDRLRADPTDRRVWISSYHPLDLMNTGQKTVPCPVGFTLSIHDNHLNSSLMIRSSDVFLGLPIDMMRHALVMRAIANSISADMQLGHMRVTLAHPHIYERQWDVALEMLNQKIAIPNVEMPVSPWTVDHVATHPDEYVGTILRACVGTSPWPDYDPRVEVVK